MSRGPFSTDHVARRARVFDPGHRSGFDGRKETYFRSKGPPTKVEGPELDHPVPQVTGPIYASLHLSWLEDHSLTREFPPHSIRRPIPPQISDPGDIDRRGCLQSNGAGLDPERRTIQNDGVVVGHLATPREVASDRK